MNATFTLAYGTNATFYNIKTECEDALEKGSHAVLDACGERAEEVAKQYCGKYSPFIDVTHEVDGKTLTVTASSEDVTSEWDGGKTEDISPVLMAEFGSGWYAENNSDDDRGGQGKLNKYGHAFNRKGWSWTENGKPFHSLGERPTRPMYTAYVTLVKEAGNIIRRVLGG